MDTSQTTDTDAAQASQTPGGVPGARKRRPIINRIRYVFDVALGIVLGCALATIIATFILVLNIGHRAVTGNGWFALLDYARVNESVLDRAADAYLLPGAAPPEEGVYWQATVDGAKQKLNGQKNYMLHFPPGGLPPNKAFWSLTITNPRGAMVVNAIERYSVSDRSGLAANDDGSVDIYIRNSAPQGHESNWLPAPDSNFKLWLRVYQPDKSVLSGEYRAPPVTEVK